MVGMHAVRDSGLPRVLHSLYLATSLSRIALALLLPLVPQHAIHVFGRGLVVVVVILSPSSMFVWQGTGSLLTSGGRA